MTSQAMTSSNYGVRPKMDIVKPKIRGTITNEEGTEHSGGSFPAREAEADCERISEQAYNRQDEHGDLQGKRSFNLTFSSGINGDDNSHVNIQLGHSEVHPGVNTPKANVNYGMEYCYGPGAVVMGQDTPRGVSLPVQLTHAPPGAPTNMNYGTSVNVGLTGYRPQDEKELKRQKRKEANRESARRSRMRKQAECDELSERVHALTQENQSLKIEVDRLNELCQKLTSENAMLLERLGK